MPIFFFFAPLQKSAGPVATGMTDACRSHNTTTERNAMNANELKAFMRLISKDKELDVSVVKEAIEQALVVASQRNLAQYNDARADVNVDTGELKLFVVKTIMENPENLRTEIGYREAHKLRSDAAMGESIEVEIDPSVMGRIAAQQARQVVMQKLREAERRKVFSEFSGKEGEVISGTVSNVTLRRDVILNVGRGAEALLPRDEMPSTSRYRTNDRIKVLILKVDTDEKGPPIRVSRTHPQLVAKLFEQEVPEIADGTVQVVDVVRDPGSRTKIAVRSKNPDVDPVGACVGVKGSRVQMIVRELENEKIDIVPWSDNPVQFIASAIVPAQVHSVRIHEDRKLAEVFVKSGNLSLAIGKKGQNARLAHRLTHWKLEIHSEDEERKLALVDHEEIKRQYLDDFLSQSPKVDDAMRENVFSSPFASVELLASAAPALIVHLFDGDRDLAGEIIEDARFYLQSRREMNRRDFGQDEQEPEYQAVDARESDDESGESGAVESVDADEGPEDGAPETQDQPAEPSSSANDSDADVEPPADQADPAQPQDPPRE